jgi:hypothetical protein
MVLSCWILPRMINIYDKNCREIKAHFMSKHFFSPENRAVYETTQKPDRPEMTI